MSQLFHPFAMICSCNKLSFSKGCSTYLLLWLHPFLVPDSQRKTTEMVDEQNWKYLQTTSQSLLLHNNQHEKLDCSVELWEAADDWNFFTSFLPITLLDGVTDDGNEQLLRKVSAMFNRGAGAAIWSIYEVAKRNTTPKSIQEGDRWGSTKRTYWPISQKPKTTFIKPNRVTRFVKLSQTSPQIKWGLLSYLTLLNYSFLDYYTSRLSSQNFIQKHK